MSLVATSEVLRFLDDNHDRHDFCDDENTTIQLQHHVDEPLSLAAMLLEHAFGGPI